MNIATLSKHLPLVISYVQTPPGDCLLEVVHLVESARYHLVNLNELIAGNGSAPANFMPGVDFRGEVLNEHWRVIASWIEFEAFLNASKPAFFKVVVAPTAFTMPLPEVATPVVPGSA